MEPASLRRLHVAAQIGAVPLIRAALAITTGRELRVADVLDTERIVPVHLAATVVWFVVAGLLVAVGAVALLVGLVVALPLALVGTAFTYRILTDGAVAP